MKFISNQPPEALRRTRILLSAAPWTKWHQGIPLKAITTTGPASNLVRPAKEQALVHPVVDRIFIVALVRDFYVRVRSDGIIAQGFEAGGHRGICPYDGATPEMAERFTILGLAVRRDDGIGISRLGRELVIARLLQGRMEKP